MAEQDKKNIVIFGAGAMGAYLTRAGHKITLVDTWFELVEKARKEGMTVITPDEEFTQKVHIIHHDELRYLPEKIDILFVCVKSYDTEWVTRYCLPHLKPDSWVVSGQNGINEDIIVPIVGAERCIGLIILSSGGMYEVGKALSTSGRERGFVIGELDGKITQRAEQLRDLLEVIAEARVTDNLYGERWSKLNLNCMCNSACGMSGLTTHKIFAHPKAVSIQVHIGGEVVKIARALGIRVPDPLFMGISPDALVRSYDGDKEAFEQIKETLIREANFRIGVRDSKPSMLQDVLKKRRTEIDYLNGYVVRKGEEVGIDPVANKAMVEVMKKVERGEIEASEANFDLLQRFIN